MEKKKSVTAQLHELFNPRSVAVVGLPRGMKSGKLFLIALQDLGYPGHIYPVHPEAREIDGIRAYPNIS
ncbi:MAG: CoA-binding protein, partial [Pseudomonadota bacterium]